MPETNRRKVAARLARDGWQVAHDGAHDKYTHADQPGVTIIVPRHATLSPGVARSIARAAGWE